MGILGGKTYKETGEWRPPIVNLSNGMRLGIRFCNNGIQLDQVSLLQIGKEGATELPGLLLRVALKDLKSSLTNLLRYFRAVLLLQGDACQKPQDKHLDLRLGILEKMVKG